MSKLLKTKVLKKRRSKGNDFLKYSESQGDIMSDINIYPRIYLAIDNCFAAKRWTAPPEWGSIIKNLGLQYIEASADNECDPLYNGPEYFIDWIKEVKETEEELGVKIVNLYSGHGTYSTLGLGHNINKVHDRMLNKWLKSIIKISSYLGAGMGFFCHAFNQKTLQDQQLYDKTLHRLYDDFAYLAKYAADKGLKTISVEQMYTPHQVPWTIEGATDLLKEVYARLSRPFYLTIDVGHQCFQKRYQMPDCDMIKEYLRQRRASKWVGQMWLGPESAYQIFNEALSVSGLQESDEIEKIVHSMNEYPYMFADSKDSNPYNWLSKLGCWSPIIHLQQTDSTVSAHKPFTDEYNRTGIIDGNKVLDEIAKSYRDANRDSMPQVCREIYLTIEVFSGTGAMPIDIINCLQETVKYWRQFVPEDGLSLDKLLEIKSNYR